MFWKLIVSRALWYDF